MPSRAEQIIQAINTALTVPAMSSVAADDVYLDLDRAIEKAKTVAIAIERGGEPAPQMDGLVGKAERRLDVRVIALAKGAAPLTALDPVLVESYNRIMADRTLGGLALDIIEGEADPDIDRLEKPVGKIFKTYTVEFRTAAHSLES